MGISSEFFESSLEGGNIGQSSHSVDPLTKPTFSKIFGRYIHIETSSDVRFSYIEGLRNNRFCHRDHNLEDMSDVSSFQMNFEHNSNDNSFSLKEESGRNTFFLKNKVIPKI